MRVRADQQGLHLAPDLAGSWEVLFDDEPVWALSRDAAEGESQEDVLVSWPRAMRGWLDGRARIGLRSISSGEVSDLGVVQFGTRPDPVRFVDRNGLRVAIDKWGIVQRPFSARGAAVIDDMTTRTQEVLDVLRTDCGVEAWMSFGTLLGAARAGRVIGHDSDVDLLYLSQADTPADINVEIYTMKRALTRRGMRAVAKSGSFLTVLFDASDGAPVSIDVYASFYVGDLLHETATVRAPIPVSAVLPLRTLEFEGRMLPAPAEPAVLLEASYGPGWRTPDPSFRHRPGPEIVHRFDDWFGSLMTHRRVWENWWAEHQHPGEISGLADQLRDDLPPRTRVVEIGSGNGSDALHLGRAGHRVLGLDYARAGGRRAVRLAREGQLTVRFRRVNLYDLRDVLTLAAQERRPGGARWVLARNVLDAVHPRAHDAFWRLNEVLLRGGGRAYLEFDEVEGLTGRCGTFPGGPPRYSVTPDDVRRRVEARGGRILRMEVVRETPGDTGAGSAEVAPEDAHRTRSTWHVVVGWP